MKENINALDEINKGATMGMNALHFILDKVKDNEFREVLNNQYEQYEGISMRIAEIYRKYNSSDEPHETSKMDKAMTWSALEMKTMGDKSNSNIAEILINGTNMGIIEGRKILNNKNMDEEVKNLVEEFVKMQESAVEVLKSFL